MPPNKPEAGKPTTAKKKSGAGGAFLPTLAILGVLVAVTVVFASFWTELKWFEQIEAARVFWTQYGAWLVLAAVGAVVFTLFIALNLRIAMGGKFGKKALPATEPLLAPVSAQMKLNRLARGKPWLSLGVAPLVVGILAGTTLGADWRSFLLWLNSTPFNQKDPEFGLDISFYVFSLPVLHLLLSYFFMLIAISLLAAMVGYWINSDIATIKGKLRFSKKAQLHVGILATLATLGVAAVFWLSRYDLLLGNNDRFSGASFTDINASKPGLTILAISVLLVAVLFAVAAMRRTWKLAIVGIASTVAAGLVLTGLYPVLLQNFKVDPNAAELESEFIQRNIDATLKAYGLDQVESRQYAARTDATPGQLRQDSQTAAQIRLLDPNIVSPSFNQLQQNRQYYEFLPQLSVDRYRINGEMRDTVISVRELNLDGLDNSRRSWVNDHTVFTHGFGVAAAYGNTATTKGDPAFWEAGIPSSGEIGDYESRVYFGQQSPEYSIVGAPKGTDPWELDYPDDSAPNGQVNTTYKGDGGPKISNAFEKLMFAIRFRSTEMFFSDRVTSQSQILFDRDPRKRVAKVAPYLTLDSKVIPAVVDMDNDPKTPKELVWIIDGYTTSNNYPYSARETLNELTADARTKQNQIGQIPDQINYIRNSVKAVVNAYDGKVTLYQWDQKDPIINAWKNIFPGQVTPLEQMPGDLIAHVRYPEDLFKVQRGLLARYHVKDAKSFYSGGDFWQVPREPTVDNENKTAPNQPPYYLTLQMPGQEQASFSLTTSYIPGGNTNRNVMTGFLAVDSNAGHETGKIADSYGKLRLLEAPRDLTVSGPGQAENAMLTSPDVSTALNLLRRGGTEVMEGNLLSLPIGGGLLYVQPIYVQAATGTKYPTLQYVLAMFGDKVGFAPTLDAALDKVFGGDSGVSAGDAAIKADKTAPMPTPDGKHDAGAGSAGSAGSEKADSGSSKAGDKAGDKGAATSPGAGGAGGAGDSAGTPQQQLDAALKKAEQAISESDTARRNGDWGAYGAAQNKLADAIKEAMNAQKAMGK
ncbi:uncharacterized membrane protein (UPF0182 family) [Arcanobacterium pluranimalium]|uniref:UPF0182 family membrane protein n=1 Tax=Arcanobacterium pluranimalium TaxID=108028 RepID=UPI00195C3BE3|nr:UPF0182 family protein [Arcanobacterium pluranimalium]MBM7825804.1 uncharacterized membrane protein (UPF0182 family) [Arcanobacterium pluranimalium]